MTNTAPPISRDEAIARLRLKWIDLTSPEKSVCQVAAERKIFCGGFGRHTDDQLRQRYAGFVGADASTPRAELEARANEWQLQRQRENGSLISCDVQWMHYQTCRGWDDFTNEELGQFCLELREERVQVVGPRILPVL